MKILVVEDRGTFLYPLIEKLESLGHEVLRAFNISQARAVWNGGNSHIDCLIVDLNVSADADAIKVIDAKNRNSGNKQWHALAGWIWLEQEKLVGKPPAQGATKIIVISGYLDVWQALGCNESDYPGVKFIRKATGTAQNVRDCIKAIAGG